MKIERLPADGPKSTITWRVDHDGHYGPITAYIRKAEAIDVPEIEGIIVDAYSKYISRLGTKPAPMESDYYNLLDTQEMFVCERDKIVVGTIILAQAENSLRIDNVAISPLAQGNGYGKILMQFAELMATWRDYTVITLYTNERMVENIALYIKMGFTETDRRTANGFNRVFFRKEIVRTVWEPVAYANPPKSRWSLE